MKVEGKVYYALETKEDLKELLTNVSFSFLPDMNEGLTQVGGWISDVRPHLALLEYVRDEFQNILTLRAQDPDLLKEFNDVVNDLVKLRDKFNDGHAILEKHNP